MTIKGTISPHPDHVLVACDELPNSEWRHAYGPRCAPRPCRHPKHNVSGRLGTCGCDKTECIFVRAPSPE